MRDIDLRATDIGVMPVNTYLCYGDTRCISGDAFIRYQVRTPEGDLQNSKGGTLARLYHRFHKLKFLGLGSYQRKQTLNSEFWAPSMTEGGRLFQNKIVDVVDSGEKGCLRIRTVGGLELVCTPDHPIADDADTGYVLAGDLRLGSKVLVHRNVPWTAESDTAPQINRPEICVKHHPIAHTKIVRDQARGYANEYKRLIRARAVYEAHMNGLSLEEFIGRLNDGALEGLQFLSADMDVHHKDENKLHDVPSNLVALSHAEHAREHFVLPNGRPRIGSFAAVHDVISSITEAGKHHTYDIKMSAPYHNFVADDFVVHNCGKTTWAGTFPRPLFLSDVTEKGYESLREDNWNNEVTPRFESDVPPIVWGIETEADFIQCLERAKPLIQSGRIKSIWLDSISFYSDLILNSILMRQSKADMRKAYGDLGIHLRNIRIQAHALGVNFGWLALARHPEEDDPVGRPLIPGQQSDKFSAGCDYIFHFRVDQPQPSQPANFNIYTKRYPVKDGRHYVAGNRLGGRANLLSSPMRGTYASMMEALGYDIDAIRKGLVPIGKTTPAPARAVSAPPKPAAMTVAKPSTIVIKGVSNGSSVDKSAGK